MNDGQEDSDAAARRRLNARRADADASSGDSGLVSGTAALMRYAGQVGRRFAIVNAVERRARAVEERLLGEIGERLQNRERSGATGSAGSSKDRRAERAFYVPVHEPPARLFEELLSTAERQGAEEAHEYFCTTLLRQLTPDEALLLTRFSDGEARAVLQLELGGRLGAPGERLAGYFSLLEEELTLRLPERLPHYLQRMHRIGLLREGDPTDATKVRHGSLQQHPAVRAAQAESRRTWARPRPRFASLYLSELGGALWAAVRPESREAGSKRGLLGAASRGD